jgi:diphosphomevalonate decarboxylase
MGKLKAKAIAHPMQGLVKYHGLRDWRLRIPYHDSISVNLDSLYTISEVEFGEFERDELIINDRKVSGKALARVLAIIKRVRELANVNYKVRIVSRNSLPPYRVKGVGFSSAAGASIATASFKALNLDKIFSWDIRLISRIARLMAGSACRSVVGGYARWYAGNDDESSYAVKFADKNELDMITVVVPFYLNISTEKAHRDSISSPFFSTRIKSAQKRADELEKAIKDGDFKKVGELVEQDTMELHAVTMTGKNRLMIYRKESIELIRMVKQMREKDRILAYYSMQTGPTVFINTLPEYKDEIEMRLKSKGYEYITCRVGEGARII